MWKRNIYARQREMWNVFKVCESKVWMPNAKLCESEKC